MVCFRYIIVNTLHKDDKQDDDDDDDEDDDNDDNNNNNNSPLFLYVLILQTNRQLYN